MARRTSKKDKDKLVLIDKDELYPNQCISRGIYQRARESAIAWRHCQNFSEAGDGPLELGRQIHEACGDLGCFRYEMKITGYCTICQEVLSHDYPDDYPEEWKFCCSCFRWAKMIVLQPDSPITKELLKKADSPIFMKIYRKITLVGNAR